MKKKKAFTLIELVMVIVILGVIAGFGVAMTLEVTEGWLLQFHRKEMSESARVAIDRMTREIRRINDTTSLIAADDSNLQFIDLDDNNITYNLSSTTLRRTINGTTNDLADNLDLDSLSFTYYDASGATIGAPQVSPDPTDVARIDISLTFSLGGSQLSVNSQVSPRRLQGL